MSENTKVRILLADGHSLFREAVRAVLESEGGMEVVAEAHEGLQAVSEAERSSPDVALLDAGLTNCDSIRATELIRERVPGCRVLVLSGEANDTTLANAMTAGASGYLSKEHPLAELLAATRSVHRGETSIPPRMLGTLLAHLIRRRRDTDEALKHLARLTRREKEVLLLLAEGSDNDGIAQNLVISPQTARTHIQNVLGKLGVHSRLEAAAFVLQNGIKADLPGVSGDSVNAH
ncbi:MAG: response regulator [Actinomycetota bacterium]